MRLPGTFARYVLFCTLCLSLPACSPHYNWREVRDVDKSFTVLLPAKPATFTRRITLGDHPLVMTMTAAEVDKTTFAIGVVTLSPELDANTVMAYMAAALTANIAGQLVPEQLAYAPRAGVTEQRLTLSGTNKGRPARLIAHLQAHNSHVFQILMLRTGSEIDTEQAETFFSSFAPH